MLSRPTSSSLYLFFVAFLFILHSVKASSSDSAAGSVSLSDSADGGDGGDGTIIDPALLALLEAANGGPIDPVVLAQVVLAANILDIPLDGIESAEQVAALLALLNQFTPSPPPTNPPTNPTPMPTSPTPPPTNPTPAPITPATPDPTPAPADPPATPDPTPAPVDPAPPAPTAAPVDPAPPTEPVTTLPGATAAPTGSPVTVSPTTSLPTTSAPTSGAAPATDGALNRAKEAPKVGMPAGNLQQIAGCPCDFSLSNFQANCDAMTCEYATTKDLGLLQCGTKIFGVTTGAKGRCGDNSSGNGNAVLTESQGRECLEDFKASAAGTGCKDSSPKPKAPPAAPAAA